MRPAARLSAAIDILSALDESNTSKGPSLEDLARSYFRGRRYAGSGDRRAVRGALYDLVRHWGSARYLAQAAGLAATPRSWVLAYARAFKPEWLDLFGSETHGPAALDKAETAAFEVIERLKDEMPDWAIGNVPADIHALLHAGYGTQTAEILAGLEGRAPVTLRYNAPRTTQGMITAILAGAGIEAHPARFAPSSLIAPPDAPLTAMPAYDNGLFEIQDEASQLAALLVQPPPGGLIVDLCAGAGGKALALAARHPKSRIVACDISEAKLAELSRRAERAQAAKIETVLLPAGFPAEPCPQLDALAGQAHAVMVDAPCSSSGTWRRRPETRWRYDASDIKNFAEMQGTLAGAGWGLLRPGGHMVFATCSLLTAEGEDVATAFLATTPSAELLPAHDWLARHDDVTVPPVASGDGQYLRTLPHAHGCDGFFAACMRKRAGEFTQ